MYGGFVCGTHRGKYEVELHRNKMFHLDKNYTRTPAPSFMAINPILDDIPQMST